ncbi:MAG: right-handed parallel beta-helix repeat-containing protein [Candidatus Pedobacter colombiensis]|uniref:Right-handed parallel beta-helix repeat-containing protein n=1 Tax=Candidatus Pedobacter colombiensis TaxID=3121371 RepID=A0AAJ5W498_9SPHI|nr:L-rhamnose mutarotase [Pedobacter sp.]WEK17692.1 MAG: right-handed parallel beta-helix repeat-containing protein [Pedobacter sp.]
MNFKPFWLVLLAGMLLSSIPSLAADIYVSLKGSDKNEGTKTAPVASLSNALRKARELRRLKDPSIKNGINIFIEQGVYYLTESVILRPEDSGTAGSPTVITTLDENEAVLSGGLPISGWKKVVSNVDGLPNVAKGKVWVADVSDLGNSLLEFRQLWVDGKKAIRARDWNGAQMGRILSWNFPAKTCKIPFSMAKYTAGLEQIKGIEMVIQQWWAIANLRVKSIKVNGAEAELSFIEPESRVQSEHPWPAPWISARTGNSPYYLTNAIQFLDEPGEWYEDLKNDKVYYWPRSGENMNTAKVVVPNLETLVRVEGTIDNQVAYVSFKGISFQHAGWLRPSRFGHVPHQAGMYMLDAYKLKIPGTPDKKGLENQAWVGRPAAAVEISYAHHTGFEACKFEHHASTGLDYRRGTHDNEIKGNLFKDIGGSGILVGVFSDEAAEVHLPYNPTDQREICTNESITNNLITDATNEDWGCVGIGAGYVRGINIAHNEISDVAYSGISMGWGWTKTINAMRNNTIHANKVHHYGKYLYDVAGIYTLSAQPGSVISNNYIDSIYKAPYPHDPEHWFYLYTDEGSSYFTVKNNWTPAEKYLQNANGPGNVWSGNGPKVADSIKFKAGLEHDYVYLLNSSSVKVFNQPVNSVESGNGNEVAIEVVLPSAAELSKPLMVEICREKGISASAVYQWNNRLLVYATMNEAEALIRQFQQRIKGAEVRLYKDVFYTFNRKKHCGQEPVKEWDNIILSTNLVKDEAMQKEYLNYHATQFDKWPEVAKGFCNADFQQLRIFKNGRQLMLVISIPKGTSLDELNPKTTLNNPKVDEWNVLMKKYQEGIAGTKPDEVWVFFSQNN